MALSTETTTAESTRSAGQPILLLGSLSALAALSLDMYVPGLPAMAADLDTTASATQLTLTACLIGLALGQLFVGPLSDARGRRRPLLIGVALYTAASVLCALAPSIWVLIPMRLVQGAAGGAGMVIATAAVRDRGDDGTATARLFATLMVVNGIAPIAAPVIGGQLLHWTTWRGVFLVLAGIGAALLAASVFLFGESLPAERRRAGGGPGALLPVYRRLLRDRVFVGCLLGSGLALGGMFGYISGSPFVLQDIHGLTAQQYSLVFAANGAGIVLGSQASRVLVGRFRPRALMLAGLAGVTAGGVGVLLSVLGGAGLPVLLPMLFLNVACLGLVMPNAGALGLAKHGDAAGAAASLLGPTPYVLGALASPLVGLGGRHDAAPMGVVIALFDALALGAFAILTRGTRTE
ncbi:MAG TPA: multidrug effflux MFS transporter [Thermomicrobiaceae bacterium]|nr:multidrug effflux MFS transporter [Thermomicrobiaceae bacterium]